MFASLFGHKKSGRPPIPPAPRPNVSAAVATDAHAVAMAAPPPPPPSGASATGSEHSGLRGVTVMPRNPAELKK